MSYEFNVRCAGKIHRIYLADNGQLCLCDHKGGKHDREEMEALVALGSELPRCYRIMDFWKHRLNGEKLPLFVDMLRRITMIGPKSLRSLRHRAKFHNYKVFDTTKLDYPSYQEMLNLLPEDIKSQNPKPEHMPRIWAVLKVAEELQRRGRKVKYLINLKQTYYGTSLGSHIGKVDDISAGAYCGPHHNSNGIFSFSEPFSSISISINENIMPALIADLIEARLYFEAHKIISLSPSIDVEVNRREKLAANISKHYPKLAKVDVKGRIDKDKFEIRAKLSADDATSAAVFMSELNKLVKRFDNRIKVESPTK